MSKNLRATVYTLIIIACYLLLCYLTSYHSDILLIVFLFFMWAIVAWGVYELWRSIRDSLN
jgi:predicted MFS family arabinose efflux permease